MSHPLDIECPLCAAEPGQQCVGKFGRERKSFHRARGSRGGKKLPHAVYAYVSERTESPIESILLSTLLEWLRFNGITGVSMTPQGVIGPFRADVLIEHEDRLLCVECDGKAFHGSQEQVERDKRRDRYCASRGICVMRFSGAEISRDPRGCAAEIGCWIKLP